MLSPLGLHGRHQQTALDPGQGSVGRRLRPIRLCRSPLAAKRITRGGRPQAAGACRGRCGGGCAGLPRMPAAFQVRSLDLLNINLRMCSCCAQWHLPAIGTFARHEVSATAAIICLGKPSKRRLLGAGWAVSAQLGWRLWQVASAVRPVAFRRQRRRE